MAHKLIKGTQIALQRRRAVTRQVAKLAEAGWQPKLVSVVFKKSLKLDQAQENAKYAHAVLVRDDDEDMDEEDSAIAWYVRNQRRVAEKCGILFEELAVSAEVDSKDFVSVLEKINQDPRVTGVVMQRPFPPHLSPDDVQNAIHPLKDVEGMHPTSIGNVVYDESDLVPCTAKAAVACLKSTSLASGPERSLKGLSCVVVGHSEIVGKPISFLLMNEQAVVTTCHHMTRDLSVHTRKADAVFVAVGKANLIRGDMLKPGCAVIDVGINPIQDPETGEESIVGDVDMESCLPVAGWITPVPGGVGPVTTAALMENTVRAAEAQKLQYEAVFGPSFSATNQYMFTN
ncbi:C-1-tetrahydrofolate synthase, mitochondrial [Hondaea fermentalgiana]|uniref:C-1-tetrahydrofolate synthase, mitochondrial n=1 Tax=Hondaea fermentalgiana TaxID=2315210 RepID=A0A2R5GJW9_9STRA|nr:C-1-tetrahydrofolate synthase, mitochondrial [Hondaea fermentalgiana]|eukprot:GBG30925.1 C-1-tetrahydrofolate synthase, mitochondrial [Hondaea fermentalgiana]